MDKLIFDIQRFSELTGVNFEYGTLTITEDYDGEYYYLYDLVSDLSEEYDISFEDIETVDLSESEYSFSIDLSDFDNLYTIIGSYYAETYVDGSNYNNITYVYNGGNFSVDYL